MQFVKAINFWFFSLAFVACGIITQEQLRAGRWPNDRVEASDWLYLVVDWYVLALIVFWIQLAVWTSTGGQGRTSGWLVPIGIIASVIAFLVLVWFAFWSCSWDLFH